MVFPHSFSDLERLLAGVLPDFPWLLKSLLHPRFQSQPEGPACPPLLKGIFPRLASLTTGTKRRCICAFEIFLLTAVGHLFHPHGPELSTHVPSSWSFSSSYQLTIVLLMKLLRSSYGFPRGLHYSKSLPPPIYVPPEAVAFLIYRTSFFPPVNWATITKDCLLLFLLVCQGTLFVVSSLGSLFLLPTFSFHHVVSAKSTPSHVSLSFSTGSEEFSASLPPPSFVCFSGWVLPTP